MPPYFLLSALIGAIYGTLFHLWRGKTALDLPVYLLTGVIGFGLGQILGDVLGVDLLLLGPIHVVEATLVGWGCLFLIYWLKIK
ncbi:MAG: hypothetical protein JW953_19250 [Anaerolineae bacterium]|nr:hypothetical protein [Anaerolineae bacterium]